MNASSSLPVKGIEGTFSQYGPSLNAIFIIIASLLAIYVGKVVQYRRGFKHLHGPLPSPPFSMWFGTIPGIAGLYKNSPTDTHPMTTMTVLWRKYNLGNLYFLDNWPAADCRQILVNDPAVAAQAVNLEKYHLYPNFVGHVVGKTSMLITEGKEWKKTRALFNPGFAAGHLMTLVPSIVDDTTIFVKILNKLADSGEIKPLDDALARLTIDIMGHVVLDHDLNSQTSENEMVDGFRGSVKWSPKTVTTNPFQNLNPMMPIAHWYYTRITDNYIKKVIKQRLALRPSNNGTSVKKSGRRPAIDLAVDEFLVTGNDDGKAGVVDAKFLQVATDQMKTFMFAGHDTSSSTLCYIYHELNIHPEALAKVRQEHDTVFGPLANAAEAIKKKPALLNELPFTLAIIKEVLRLYPPASTAREGSASTSLTTNGATYPTANTMVWINLHTIHRREDLFPSPDEFIPERFLPAPHNYPAQKEIVKDSWRPFEKGPRNCIGQELAILEMKIIMVMTLREFDIGSAYEEWDRMMGREKPGEMLDGKRGMFGTRAYQQMKATAKPSDDMPVKVKRRVV
ncbi:cytochrome P450 monooxygenase-like protein [Cadophora sp. DSE1049]|nr:cytochrome P450 monooxygenase-like protein [Cadophora sp. DSE1049]